MSDNTVIGQLAFELGVKDDTLINQLTNIGTSSAHNFEQQWAHSFGNVGKKLVGMLGTIGITMFTKECIDLGSDLAEVDNVVENSFKSMSAQVNEFAQNAIDGFGLSEAVAKQYMGTIGAMNNAFGIAEETSYDMATAITGLAGDVASFYNLDSGEAFNKLKAIWTSETEGLKSLGVVMTQTALDEYALNNGLGKTTAKMTEQEKVMLRYQYVTQALSTAAGDFVRTQDGWANQTRVLTLRFDSLKATLGQGFINLFTPIIKALNNLLGHLSSVAEGFKNFTEVLTGNSEVTKSLGAIADNASSTAGAVDEITSSAQEAQKELAGFDKITKLGDVSGTNVSNKIETDIEVNGGDEAEQEITTLNSAFARELELLKEMIQAFKIGDYFTVGEDVSNLVIGFNNYIAEAIRNVDWAGMGENVGEFIAGINWTGVLFSLADVFTAAIEGAADFWFASLEEAPFETAIITAIAVWKFTGVGQTLAGKIAGSLEGTRINLKNIAVAAALEMVSFNMATKDNADWKDRIVGMLAGAVGGYTVAGPWGAAIGLGVNLALQLSTYISNSESEIDKAREEINSMIEELSGSWDIAAEKLSNLEWDYESIKKTADAYYELSQKATFSETDLQVLSMYRDELEQYGINVAKWVQPGTDAWAGTREELTQVLNQQRQIIAMTAYQEILVDANKELVKARENMDALEDGMVGQDIGINDWAKQYLENADTFEDRVNYLIDNYGGNIPNIEEQLEDFYTRMYGDGENMLTTVGKYNVLELRDYLEETTAYAEKLYAARALYTNQENYIYEKETELLMIQEELGLVTIENTEDIVESGVKQVENLDNILDKMDKVGNNSKTVSDIAIKSIESIGNNVKKTSKKASDSIDSVWNLLDDFTGRTYQVTVGADTKPAKDNVDSVWNILKDFTGRNYKATVSADTKPAKDNVNSVWNILDEFSKKTYQSTISINNNPAKTAIQGIQTALDALKAPEIKIPITSTIASMASSIANTLTVQKRATGGPLEDGLFTMNRGEIAGKFFNGQTIVANNQQIMGGIAQALEPGIYSGVLAAMSSAPPLKTVGSSSSDTRHLESMVNSLLTEYKSNKEIISVLKEILVLIKNIDPNMTIDGQKLTDIIVKRINSNTQKNGVCEIII